MLAYVVIESNSDITREYYFKHLRNAYSFIIEELSQSNEFHYTIHTQEIHKDAVVFFDEDYCIT